MKLIVFGATGGTGRQVVIQALEAVSPALRSGLDGHQTSAADKRFEKAKAPNSRKSTFTAR